LCIIIGSVSDLEHWLAAQAGELGLNAVSVEKAGAELLREFCALVLTELAARGVLAGSEEIGCYAAARKASN
jgi:hypothetical protein